MNPKIPARSDIAYLASQTLAMLIMATAAWIENQTTQLLIWSGLVFLALSLGIANYLSKLSLARKGVPYPADPPKISSVALDFIGFFALVVLMIVKYFQYDGLLALLSAACVILLVATAATRSVLHSIAGHHAVYSPNPAPPSASLDMPSDGPDSFPMKS